MRKFYFYGLAFGLALMTSAVFAEEKNVTSTYIKNSGFESNFTNWIQENMQTQTNSDFTLKVGNVYVEKWVEKGNKVGNAKVYQELQNLPAGKYRLEVNAHNIQQASETTTQTGAVIYAGDDKLTVTVTDTYKLTFVTLGGNVEIGFKATSATGNWLCVDNFRLFSIDVEASELKALIDTKITEAETLLKKAMQPAFKQSLTEAVEAAKTITDESAIDDIKAIGYQLSTAYDKAETNVSDVLALKKLTTTSKAYLAKAMAEIYKTPLQEAYDEAMPIVNQESDNDVYAATSKISTALDAAKLSYTATSNLTKAIRTATNLNKTDKVGVEALEAAIAEAQLVVEQKDATPEVMDAATAKLENATLLFRVNNATGSIVTSKTLSVIQGATTIFGRASFSGGTPKEKGFCYSENPEPTIFDGRSTTLYSNNGDIYEISGLKPATVYYVRAYAIGTGYQLTYGDVVKTVTRPMGNVTFSYGYEGDEATNQRIFDACAEAVWMWNNIGGIQDFHLSAHYKYGAGAGTGTAECSYGGYMSVSQNTGCQRTGTILHEGSHGLGVIPYTDWTNSIYRTNGDRGDWLGPRVDRVMQFLENSSTAKLHGDNQHMWPYGINGASEDTGSPMLYRANALIVEALSEDGIAHSGQYFLTPGYAFESEDDVKYYIKSEDTNRGVETSYLRQKNNTLRFEELTADEVFSNDSCAWYITFNPSTCYYTLCNAATGYYLNMPQSVASLSRTASTPFHLLASREQTKVGNYTFAGRAYWLVSSNSYKALNANASNFTGVEFNHANSATTQRWLLLSGDEVTKFAEARGKTVGISKAPVTNDGELLLAGGNGTLSISAIGTSQDVQVVGLDGRLLQSLYIQANATATIRLPRGIYIVNSKKVIVR